MNEKQIQRFYEGVASQVAAFRKAANPPLTQEELASRLPSLSRSTIANIESGRQRIALHQLVEVADAVGVSLLEFLRAKPSPAAEENMDPFTRSFLDSLSPKSSRNLLTQDEANEE